MVGVVAVVGGVVVAAVLVVAVLPPRPPRLLVVGVVAVVAGVVVAAVVVAAVLFVVMGVSVRDTRRRCEIVVYMVSESPVGYTYMIELNVLDREVYHFVESGYIYRSAIGLL